MVDKFRDGGCHVIQIYLDLKFQIVNNKGSENRDLPKTFSESTWFLFSGRVSRQQEILRKSIMILLPSELSHYACVPLQCDITA